MAPSLAACVALSACMPGPDATAPAAYGPGQATLLTDDLLQVTVEMSGAPAPEALRGYADCMAAGAAVFHGRPFARHVRTTRAVEAGIQRADAVYTVSPTLPEGLRTIDAETLIEACEENGIPTV